MSKKYRDWASLLPALLAGDPAAIVDVTAVIIGLLARARAFDLRPSWDELSHEVLVAFLLAVRKGHLERPEASVGYLDTITRRKLYEWKQRQERTPAGGADRVPIDSLEQTPEARPDAGAERAEVLVELERALAALSEREREVITAVCLEGRTYDEAAEKLGMPLGTLKHIRGQALRTLRSKLSGVVP